MGFDWKPRPPNRRPPTSRRDSDPGVVSVEIALDLEPAGVTMEAPAPLLEEDDPEAPPRTNVDVVAPMPELGRPPPVPVTPVPSVPVEHSRPIPTAPLQFGAPTPQPTHVSTQKTSLVDRPASLSSQGENRPDGHRLDVVPVAHEISVDVPKPAPVALRANVTESKGNSSDGPTVVAVGPRSDVDSEATGRRAINLQQRRIRERTRSDESTDLQPLYDARAALLYEEAVKAVAKRDFVTAERHLALALSYMPNEPRLVEARDKVRRLRRGDPASP